jgi:hypothetical protein
MQRILIRLLILIVLALAGTSWFLARKATARPQTQSTCAIDVPSNWGEYVGSSEHYGLVFKDDAGTLRFATNVPCSGVPQVGLQVNRTSPSN